MHHLIFGINFQIHIVSLTNLVLIHLLIHFSTHLYHHPHGGAENDGHEIAGHEIDGPSCRA